MCACLDKSLAKVIGAVDLPKSTEWLMANASPPVRYLTCKHVLTDRTGVKTIRKLWAEVEKSRDAQEIFTRQQEDGSWCAGGHWAAAPTYQLKKGHTPYSPKYATTVWLLTILGDMGFDINDARVRKACEYTMNFQCADGTFGTFGKSSFRRISKPKEPPNIPCHFAGYLMGLAKVGMGTDKRLDKSYDLLIRWQRDDGGWLNERHLTGRCSPYKVWTRSCPWATYFCCQALRHSGRDNCLDSYIKALRFMGCHMASKSTDAVTRFYYHGHETVKELLMFSESPEAQGPRVMATLVHWLLGMYDAEAGHFRYGGKPFSKMSRKQDGHPSYEFKYRLYHVIEDDWLTYYALRILSNLRGGKGGNPRKSPNPL